MGLVGLAVGGVLGWVALRTITWSDVLQAAGTLDWRVLFLALGTVFFAGLMEALRWKLLLHKEPVSTVRLFLVKHAGQGLNNFSPVRLVAEAAQTAMLRYGNGISTPKVVCSLLMARLFDLLVTVNLMGAGLVVLPQLAGFRPFVLPLWAMTSAALIALVVLGGRMHRMPGVRRFGALEAMLRTIGSVGARPRVMLACILLTAASWMSIGAAAWLVAGAAGIELPFWLMAIVIVAVTLFSATTPAPPGAVGVYEFAVISTLTLFAVEPSVALTFALVVHGILFLPAMLIGIPVLALERKTLKGILTWRRKTSAPVALTSEVAT